MASSPASRSLCLQRLVPALFLGLILFIHPAHAQQEFKLQEDGKWQAQPAPDPSTPAGQIQAIRTALAQDNPGSAQSLANQWIENYPNHALLAQAHQLRGDALVAQKDLYNALFDYEVVLRQFPGTEEFNIALEREYEIARLFSNGARRKFLGMNILSAYTEAEELFIRLQERAPGSAIGEKSSAELGEHYLRRGEMHNAATAFEMFLANYPRSLRREYVMLRLIQADLAQFKGPTFDATGLIEAAQRLGQYQKEFPAAAEKIGAAGLLARIEESLAGKNLETARWYETRGEKVSASYGYQRLLRDYPRTSAAQQALRLLERLDPAALASASPPPSPPVPSAP